MILPAQVGKMKTEKCSSLSEDLRAALVIHDQSAYGSMLPS